MLYLLKSFDKFTKIKALTQDDNLRYRDFNVDSTSTPFSVTVIPTKSDLRKINRGASGGLRGVEG